MATDPTLDVEEEIFSRGATAIVGVDEVGRGAIAGPVVVGVALITSATAFPVGLRDSKLVSAKRREALIEPISQWVTEAAVGEASAAEVDEWGIVAALARAGERAFARLQMNNHNLTGATVILDGTHNWLRGSLIPAMDIVTRPKADRDCAVVAAASVWAKVYRDGLMVEAGAHDDRFDWASNKGYGSTAHLDAVRRHGATEFHRKTWLTSVSGTPSNDLD